MEMKIFYLRFSEYGSLKSSTKTSIEMDGADTFESKQRKTESITSEVQIESQKEVSSKSTVHLEESVETSRERKSTTREETQNINTKNEEKILDSKKEESISMILPITRETREKSAEDKLEELDTKLKFVKMIRGASVERKSIILPVILNVTENFKSRLFFYSLSTPLI